MVCVPQVLNSEIKETRGTLDRVLQDSELCVTTIRVLRASSTSFSSSALCSCADGRHCNLCAGLRVRPGLLQRRPGDAAQHPHQEEHADVSGQPAAPRGRLSISHFHFVFLRVTVALTKRVVCSNAEH